MTIVRRITPKIGNLYQYLDLDKRNYLIFSPHLMDGVFTVEKTNNCWTFLPHCEEEVFMYLGKDEWPDDYCFWAMKHRGKVRNSSRGACHDILFGEVLQEVKSNDL